MIALEARTVQGLKRYSPSVGRNKVPLCEVLKTKVEGLLLQSDYSFIPQGGRIRLLEIASGTGEHAFFFASTISYLDILPTEPDAESLDSIRAFAAELPLSPDDTTPADGSGLMRSVMREPLHVDAQHLAADLLPDGFGSPHAILCSNMVHISPWASSVALFDAAAALLPARGVLFAYGPYKETGRGEPLAEGNASFDATLKSKNPEWGIREVDDLTKLAVERGMQLESRVSMPANNLFPTFRKE